MANPLAKLQLLLELNNKLKGGLDAAKKQIKNAVGGMQGKLDAFSKSNVKMFDAIKSEVPGASSAIGFLTNPYTLAAAAAVAAGAAIVKCTKMAAEWHEKMAEINVTAEKSPAELKKLSDAMLEIGSRNANPLDQIPKAYSVLIGALNDADLSLKTLEPTLQAAKAGFVDVEVAADAVTNVMGATGIKDATKVYDVLFATVKEGKAAFSDIANYMPKVIPAAKNIGIEFEQTAGAFAFLTKSLNTRSTSTALEGVMRAFSNQKVAIGEIDKETGKYVSGFRSLGVEVFDKQGKMRSLVDIMTDLNTKMTGLTDKQRMLKFDKLGLDQSAALGISIMMQNVDGLRDSINATTDSANGLADAVKYAKTPMDSWRIMGNMIQVGMIKIGEVFLPIVQQIGEKILGVINYFKDLYNRSVAFRDFIKGLGIFIEGAVKAAWMPLKLLIGLFQTLGDIVALAWNKLKEWGFVDFIKGIYHGIRPYMIYIKELLGGVADIMYDFLTLNFKGAYKKFKAFRMPNLDEIKQRIKIEQDGDFEGVQTDDGKPVAPLNPDKPDDDARAIKGGAHTKNITINISQLAKIDKYSPKSEEINNMNKDQFEHWMTELFMRVVRSAEMAI